MCKTMTISQSLPCLLSTSHIHQFPLFLPLALFDIDIALGIEGHKGEIQSYRNIADTQLPVSTHDTQASS